MIDITSEDVFCSSLSGVPIDFGYLSIRDRKEFIEAALAHGLIVEIKDKLLVRPSDRRCIVKVSFTAGNSKDRPSRTYKVGQSIIVNQNFGFHQIGILPDD